MAEHIQIRFLKSGHNNYTKRLIFTSIISTHMGKHFFKEIFSTLLEVEEAM